MDGLADIIGCKPPLKEYFRRHPLIWLTIMYGPTQATQYRLVGPGSKKREAHKIIKQLPVSKFNNVVKIGFRMRLAHALDSINGFAQGCVWPMRWTRLTVLLNRSFCDEYSSR